METMKITLFLILTAGLIITLVRTYKNVVGRKHRAKPILVRTKGLLTILAIALSISAMAQTYNTNTNGIWTTGSTWQGGTAPTTNGLGSGRVNINHDVTINGNLDFRASSWVAGVQYGLEIAATKLLQINGNLSISNGGIVNVYGTLYITGNASINTTLNIKPGGKVIVDGNLTILNSPYLTVGTNAAPPPYADLVVKNNMVLNSSGDIIVERNGRVAIFKNMTSDASGGAAFTVRNGGQVYIDGNISLTGGGDAVTNANGTTPIGLYVNGTSTTNGNGASITTNKGNKATMFTNDKPFYDWVALQNGALPITLLYFKVDKIDQEGVTLTWATAMEENFDKFAIERSVDGTNYETVAEVKGAGNSKTTLHYSFTDSNTLIGNSYYRLNAIDFDGSHEYSKVVYVEYAGNKTWSVYPNPSTGASVHYTLNFDPSEGDKIMVLDFFGSEVATASVSIVTGEIIFGSSLKRGTYVIKYVSNDFQKVERLIVR